jgi:ribosomal protein S11
VGGKMAQIGSRLVDAAAAKISEDFFQAFETKLREEVGVPVEAPAPVAAAAPSVLARYGWWIAGGALILLALAWWLGR